MPTEVDLSPFCGSRKRSPPFRSNAQAEPRPGVPGCVSVPNSQTRWAAGSSLKLGGPHLDKLSFGAGRRHRRSLLLETIDVKLDRLTDEP